MLLFIEDASSPTTLINRGPGLNRLFVNCDLYRRDRANIYGRAERANFRASGVAPELSSGENGFARNSKRPSTRPPLPSPPPLRLSWSQFVRAIESERFQKRTGCLSDFLQRVARILAGTRALTLAARRQAASPRSPLAITKQNRRRSRQKAISRVNLFLVGEQRHCGRAREGKRAWHYGSEINRARMSICQRERLRGER